MKNLLKTQTIILSLILFPVFLSNIRCKDKDAKPISKVIDSDNNDYASMWDIQFSFIDSLGNNLIPCDLPDTSVFNPKDFYVTSDSFSDLFFYKYYKSQNDYACWYTFRFGEVLSLIRSSSKYQIDSTYKVKVCFANECNTLISRIYSNEEQTRYYLNTGKHLYVTKWVLWNRDTIFTEKRTVIPLIIKQ